MTAVREEMWEEILILDGGLMVQETLERLAAKGIFNQQVMDCCCVCSRFCRETLCTAQSSATTRIVSGDILGLT